MVRHITSMKSNRMSKIMLNYRPNGRRRLERPLKRLLDEAETDLLGLIRDGWWWSWCVIIRLQIVNTTDLLRNGSDVKRTQSYYNNFNFTFMDKTGRASGEDITLNWVLNVGYLNRCNTEWREYVQWAATLSSGTLRDISRSMVLHVGKRWKKTFC